MESALLVAAAILAVLFAGSGLVKVLAGEATRTSGFFSLTGAFACGYTLMSVWGESFYANLLVWDQPLPLIHNALGLVALAFLIMAVFHFLLRQNESAD